MEIYIYVVDYMVSHVYILSKLINHEKLLSVKKSFIIIQLDHFSK